MTSLPYVTVIIPTYRDWRDLELCLRALSLQTYPADRIEILIINNLPSSKPPPKFQLIANARLLEEAKPGSYAARNKGLSVARGDIVAFTDSDGRPERDWVRNAVIHLQGGAERIAGRVALHYHSDCLSAVENFEKAFAFRQKDNAAAGISVTANMFTWRKTFDRVGAFNDALMSGGDIEWGLRARDAGIGITYAPDVIVEHPARHSFGELLAKARRVAGGRLQIERSKGLLATLKWLGRGLLPPFRAWRQLRQRDDLTPADRAGALAVLYLVKLYSTMQQLLLLTGLRRPSRT